MTADSFVLLSDPRIDAIVMGDSDEPLIDLRQVPDLNPSEDSAPS